MTILGCIFLFAGCETAQKDSAGHYQYTDDQIRNNRNALMITTTSQPSGNSPLAGATGAVVAMGTLAAGGGAEPVVTSPHIDGMCFMIEMPCVGVTLVLSEANGTEVARIKTDEKGSFLFLVDPRKSYLVWALSRHYTNASGSQGPFVAGDHVTLRLKL